MLLMMQMGVALLKIQQQQQQEEQEGRQKLQQLGGLVLLKVRGLRGGMGVGYGCRCRYS
jgi:hypothetical protein